MCVAFCRNPVRRHGLACGYGLQRPSAFGSSDFKAIEAGASETAGSPFPTKAKQCYADFIVADLNLLTTLLRRGQLRTSSAFCLRQKPRFASLRLPLMPLQPAPDSLKIRMEMREVLLTTPN
jgi:hypothetical protein